MRSLTTSAFSLFRRNVKWRRTPVAPWIDARTAVDQDLSNVRVPKFGGRKQSRHSVRSFGLDFGSALYQPLNDLDPTVFGSDH